jgi:hypothetical protein
LFGHGLRERAEGPDYVVLVEVVGVEEEAKAAAYARALLDLGLNWKWDEEGQLEGEGGAVRDKCCRHGEGIVFEEDFDIAREGAFGPGRRA